jgi:aspartyl/asparaginyl-tRNA synthetase
MQPSSAESGQEQQQVEVRGWVRTVRQQKQFAFMQVRQRSQAAFVQPHRTK